MSDPTYFTKSVTVGTSAAVEAVDGQHVGPDSYAMIRNTGAGAIFVCNPDSTDTTDGIQVPSNSWFPLRTGSLYLISDTTAQDVRVAVTHGADAQA